MEAEATTPLLLVDDDPTFCRVMTKALQKRGFEVSIAHTAEEALTGAQAAPPVCAVVDLKLPGASGLTLIDKLQALNPRVRIVVLTSYASISTTVEAIKLGAVNYLAKPADADQVVAALSCDQPDEAAAPKPEPISLKRLEWEYIQKVLTDNDGNVSATARQLGMHLRTLQRKLAKYPVRR